MASSNTTHPIQDLSHSHIYFRFQCGSTSIYQWVNMLTVCLAPLITHVVFGFADPVLLSPRLPGWTDRLIQFSPITIIWRWLAIVNRRVRAQAWDRADMATSNAIFWTGTAWDGSEAMMLRSRDWIVKLPEDTHVAWLSGSTLATIAMTLQGVAAVFRLFSVPNEDWRNSTWALPDIFYPLAVLSLTRLPASLWLSNEYSFNADAMIEKACVARSLQSHSPAPPPHYQLIPQQQYSHHPDTTKRDTSPTKSPRLTSSTTMPALLWTATCLIFTLPGCGVGAYLSCSGMGPSPFIMITSASSLSMLIYYVLLCTSGGLIMTYYLLRGQGGSTVIPCINARWYKVLNGVIVLSAAAMFVITALETRIGPDGVPTVYRVSPAPT